MTRHSKIDDQLAQLYGQVPAVDCDGRCAPHICHRPVEQADREYQRAPIGLDGTTPCPYLGSDDRCWAYDRRPVICRLWGATETMPCPYGCKTDRPPLTAEQEFALFVYTLAVAGGSRLGWPQVFDPEMVMDAYRADTNGARTRFLTGRAAARAATSRAARDQRAPGRRPAT